MPWRNSLITLIKGNKKYESVTLYLKSHPQKYYTEQFSELIAERLKED